MITFKSFKSENVIIIKEDNSCDMAQVWLNDQCVFEGNFWDYYTGCHGQKFDDKQFFNWHGRYNFANYIKLYAQKLGCKAKIIRERYDCRG